MDWHIKHRYTLFGFLPTTEIYRLICHNNMCANSPTFTIFIQQRAFTSNKEKLKEDEKLSFFNSYFRQDIFIPLHQLETFILKNAKRGQNSSFVLPLCMNLNEKWFQFIYLMRQSHQRGLLQTTGLCAYDFHLSNIVKQKQDTRGKKSDMSIGIKDIFLYPNGKVSL